MLDMILIVSALLYLALSPVLKVFSAFGFVFFLSFSLLNLVSYSGFPFSSFVMLSSPLTGLLDEYALILNIIIFIVIFLRFLVFKVKTTLSYSEAIGVLCFVLLYTASLLVFSRRSLFWVYFGYEMSLIPIILIIII